MLNLRKIRADGLESKMLDVVKDDTIVKRWNDQDIVNIACGGKVAFLPLNYISYPYLPGLLRDPSFTSHYSRDELYDSFINPKIIHYASVKPWNGAPVRGDEWRSTTTCACRNARGLTTRGRRPLRSGTGR